MCSFGKNHSMLHHTRDWNLGDGRFCKSQKKLKKCMKLNWNFQWGGGIPSVGEVWIFSGITQ